MTPLFSFRARTLEGKEQIGTREAENMPELGKLLRAEGMLLIEAKSAAAKKQFNIGHALARLRGISFVDRMLFTRHMAVMIEAGVDLPRAFEVLIKQARSKRFKDILSEIRDDIVHGIDLGIALSKHPDVFSDLFVAMVKVGAESGKLVAVLHLLADQMEKTHTLRSRVKGALIYPAIVIFAMVVIGILMFLFVVPKLKQVFGDIDVQLPLPTRIIFGFSDLLVNRWYILIPGVIFVGYVTLRAINTRLGKRIRDKVFMRAPIFAALLRAISSAQIARTLSSLIESGVPIVRGLIITASTLGNVYFAQSLTEAATSVEKGRTIHEALEPYSFIYPPLVTEMIAVGEETGKLGEVLSRLASFYEAEVDQTTQNMASIVEPVLMLFIGLAVGTFAVSMLAPIYNLIGTF